MGYIQSLIHAACAPELNDVTGVYVDNCRVVRGPVPNDVSAASKLWVETMRSLGIESPL